MSPADPQADETPLKINSEEDNLINIMKSNELEDSLAETISKSGMMKARMEKIRVMS